MNISATFLVIISMLLFLQCSIYAEAIPLAGHYNVMHIGTSGSTVNGNSNAGAGNTNAETDLNICEEQLSKYRRFLLQAIISFEDVCDAYNNQHATTPTYSSMIIPDSIYHSQPIIHEQDVGLGLTFLHNYQPEEPRSEIWSFFKLLMGQFDDVEFTNIIRNAVIERCRIKLQQQRDEKRNSVVLGKKQRFHSWGGKRSQSQQQQDVANGNNFESDIIA